MNLTVREAARLLRVSDKTVYRWLSERDLPAQRVGDQYRLHRVELLEWAISNRVSFAPDLLDEPREETGSLPRLREALEAGGIFYRVEGSSRDEVLLAAARTLRLPDGIEADFVYRVLRSREELGSTAFGAGIALPHPRHPLVLHVDRPSISLCLLERPVAFGALDGEPVVALLVILSPTVRAHLHLLSSLAFALGDDRFREAIRTQWTRGEILDVAGEADARIAAARSLAEPDGPQP